MKEKDNPEEERARLIEEVHEGIRAFVQEPSYVAFFQAVAGWDDLPTQRSLDLDDYWDVEYSYIQESRVAKFKVRLEIDADEEGRHTADDEVTYTISDGEITKAGGYDPSYINGQRPVMFFSDPSVVAERRRAQGYHRPEFFVSPPVSVAELRILSNIVRNPLDSLDAAESLPLSISWPKEVPPPTS